MAYGDGGRGLWVICKGACSVGAWLPRRRGRGLEMGASWGEGGKKKGGVAYGDGGRGLRVRCKGVCGGVASAVKGAWPREGRELGGRGRGLWGWGVWSLVEM